MVLRFVFVVQPTHCEFRVHALRFERPIYDCLEQYEFSRGNIHIIIIYISFVSVAAAAVLVYTAGCIIYVYRCYVNRL